MNNLRHSYRSGTGIAPEPVEVIRARVFWAASGFTLMETIIVVAIIGMAALVTIPYFAKLSRRQKLVSAAHEIQQS
ncbi:MAG: pilus assembly FimT family protein, partial [Thermoanaerobaculia bacterium]